MQYDIIKFTAGTNGVKSIPVPFEPVKYTFRVSRKASGVEKNVAHMSLGISNADGSKQQTDCTFDDDDSTDAPFTQYYDQYCVVHIARENDEPTRVLSGTMLGYNAGNVEIDFDESDSNYRITMEIEA